MDKILQKLQGVVASRLNSAETGTGEIDVRAAVFRMGGYRIVLAIVALAALYYGLLASDRYATVSQVYVKSTESSVVTLPSVPGMFGSSSVRQDALMVQEYIMSRDMLAHLDQAIDLRSHFSSSEWDWWSRMSSSSTEEEFLEYYHSRVLLELDPESSILTITAQAYTAEYSQLLVSEIIKESESFINQISQRIAGEEVSFVENELNRAREGLSSARTNIVTFQNDNNLLSPEVTSTALQTAVNALEAEKITLETQAKTLASYLNANASELVALRDRITAVDEQLQIERTRLAGSDDDEKLNDLTARFQELELELQFAQDIYKTALVSLEQARVEAYRKLKHLVVVQQPTVADEALYPRKAYNLATLFVVLSLAYGILIMIIATIQEHRNA